MGEISIPITGCSLPVEGRVMEAARSGDVETLYQLIAEDEDVLRQIDEMQFVDTPLHIASEKGHSDFAMEMMYLKPSFATKLNKNGLGPLHLALLNWHTRLALDLLNLDKNLVRVKGKMGYTPMHSLAQTETDENLLCEFLDTYSYCIDDVTSRNETALHIAASKDNTEGLAVLLRWLERTPNRSMEQKHRVVNLRNKDGETVLHIEVSKTQPNPQIVKQLITRTSININAKNLKDSTALDILKSRMQEDSHSSIKKCKDILQSAHRPWSAFAKIPFHIRRLLAQWGHEIKYMSADRGNTLLVVTVLILTATFTATLSPPGGVSSPPDEAGSSYNGRHRLSTLQIYLSSENATTLLVKDIQMITFKGNNTVGSSVLKSGPFLWFFIPNMVAFGVSFVLTCLVVGTVITRLFAYTLMLSLTTLLFCLMVSALFIISPNNLSSQLLALCFCILLCLFYPVITPVLAKWRREL